MPYDNLALSYLRRDEHEPEPYMEEGHLWNIVSMYLIVLAVFLIFHLQDSHTHAISKIQMVGPFP